MINLENETKWVEDYVQNGDYADGYHCLLTESPIAQREEFKAVPKCIRQAVVKDCIDLAEMSVSSWGVAPGKIVLDGWEIGEYESEIEVSNDEDVETIRQYIADREYCIRWTDGQASAYLYTDFGQDCVIATITPEQLREVIVENTIAYCERVDFSKTKGRVA